MQNSVEVSFVSDRSKNDFSFAQILRFDRQASLTGIHLLKFIATMVKNGYILLMQTVSYSEFYFLFVMQVVRSASELRKCHVDDKMQLNS